MEFEGRLAEHLDALSSLVERRRAVWRDAAAHDFEQRYLSPLGQILGEYRQAARTFAEALDDAFNQLRD